MISVELKRLAHLLNDIQDQSPEMAVDFDVVLLICDLVTLTRYQTPDTINLEVQASQPFVVHLPEATLRQALLNVLLNATEAVANKAFGQVCIKVYKSRPGLTIQVIDNGTGFSQDQLDNGIRPLRTGHPCDDTDGLGLAMAQRFIQQYMGGRIKLSNQIPHGACVTIWLPAECMSPD